jgi:hypothetical protein
LLTSRSLASAVDGSDIPFRAAQKAFAEAPRRAMMLAETQHATAKLRLLCAAKALFTRSIPP